MSLSGDYRNGRKVEDSWNVMAHEQKPDFVFRRYGRVHLNQRGRHFSRLLAAEVCASAVVMLDTPCSEVVWRVLATHSIRQFPLQFPSRASTCAITFKLGSTHSIHQFPLHFPSLRHRVPSHFSWGLPTPFASFPFTSPPVRHRVPSRFNWSLPTPFASFPFTSRPVRHRVSSHFNWSLRPKLKCAVDLCNVVDWGIQRWPWLWFHRWKPDF